MTEQIRLNLGAGNVPLEGYENLDIKQGQPAYPLKRPANSVDVIRASHLLEHFPEVEAPKVIDDWMRALKPGGLLRVAVPDFEWIVQHYNDYTEPEPKALLRAYVLGGHVDEHDAHHSAWTREKLQMLMESAGLADIEDWKSEVQDSASLPVSLNLQGRKRSARQPQVHLADVRAVMSLPRLTFSANMGCALAAFLGLRIPLMTHTGAFWGQTLTNGLQKALADGAEYIFVLDYDTVFDAQDVTYMLGAMAMRPDFDCVMGTQIKRESDATLFTLRENDGRLVESIPLLDLTGEFLQVASGHFGLTVFRADRLRDLPLPWFVGVPGPSGEWDDQRLDEDMYFWKHWRDNGRNAYMAQKVRLGHIEESIAWPTRKYGVYHQRMHDYRARGRPAEAEWAPLTPEEVIPCPESDS